MKFSLLAAGLLAIPFAAHAGLIEVPRYLVDVEYWGTVSDVTQGTHEVGDSVHGRLRIDTSLAPSDTESQDPRVGDYIWNAPCERGCPPDVDAPNGFVTTDGAPSFHGRSYDRVQVFDSAGSPVPARDFFAIKDDEGPALNGGSADYLVVGLGVRSPADFISGDGIVQTFDIRPVTDVGSAPSGGGIDSLINGVASSFGFLLDRIRVTPHLCKP
jgi:hypothetical protein